MGLHLEDIYFIAQAIKRGDIAPERAMMLGVQTFPKKGYQDFIRSNGLDTSFPPLLGARTSREVFHALGFSEVRCLDVSDYEGAELIVDLNNPKPIGYQPTYIHDGGTLEHVFDIPAALRYLNGLLPVGGVIYHVNPANGYVDHGFYQISPILYLETYLQNGYEIILSVTQNTWSNRLRPHHTDMGRKIGGSDGGRYALKHLTRAVTKVMARKMAANDLKSPVQGYYLKTHGTGKQFYSVVNTDLPKIGYQRTVSGLFKDRFYKFLSIF